MATDSVNRQINIFISSGDAQKAFDVLIAKEKTLKEQLAAATDPAMIKRLNTELAKLTEPIERASKKLSGELKPSIRDLEGTANNLRRAIRSFDGSEADFQKLRLQLQNVKIDLAEAKQRAEGLQSSMRDQAGSIASSFFSGFGVGAGIELVSAAGAAVKSFFSGAIDEAMSAERGANALKATLETFGEIDAFDRLNEKANQFARTFTFIDNDDFVAVFDKLITYGKLTEQQMDQLIPVITDYYGKQKLASDVNITMASATETVIKALEGNVKGLRQYGITMGDAKTTAERFGVVMDQLGPKVSGAATAFGQDLTGQVQSADQQIKDLQEFIGGYLIPIWSKVKIAALTSFSGIIEGIAGAYNAIKNTVAAVEYLFLSSSEKAAIKQKAIEQNLQASGKEFATKQAAFYSLKPLKEQEENLKVNLALLKASQKTYDELKAQNQAATEQGKAARTMYIRDMLTVQALQKNIEALKNPKVLGINEDDTEAAQAKKEKGKQDKLDAASKKRQASEAARAEKERLANENQYNDFIQRLTDVNAKVDGINASQLDRELGQNNQKYSDLQFQYEKALKDKKLTQEQYAELSLMSEDLRGREQSAIIEKWAKDIQAKQAKLAEEDLKAGEAMDVKRMKQALDGVYKISAEIAKLGDATKGELKAQLELELIKKHGAAKLAAELELLQLEEDMEVKAAENKENKIALIEEVYRHKKRDAQIRSIQDTLGKITEFANAVLPGIEMFFQAQNEKDEQNLARERQINDQKKKQFQNQLDGKLISSADYQKKVAALDAIQEKKELEAKVKAFNREKILNLAKAAIALPSAILKALSDGGPVLAAIVGALGLLQIALIAKAKPPSFERGGILPGPGHGNGGLSVINNQTGDKVAEVEGGEAILSRRTVRNNPDLVSALLETSARNGGSSIQAAWQYQQPAFLNVAAIGQSISKVKMFEKGGVLPKSSNSSAPAPAGFSDEQFEVLISVLKEKRKSYVVLSEINDQSDRLAKIREAATAKK